MKANTIQSTKNISLQAPAKWEKELREAKTDFRIFLCILLILSMILLIS